MHRCLMAVAMLAFLLPVVGEAQRGRGAAPPRPVAGNGVEVPGWWARLDDPGQVGQGLKFFPMGSGLHSTTGPAAIFWDPQQTASGTYTVKATFTLSKPPSHPTGYGLFIGGTDLNEDDQRYTYFLVREDGKYLIKKRNGKSTSNVGGDWTEHAAVMKADASGKLSNELSIRVAGDTVTFLVNGKEVVKHPASALDTSGSVGLRINHGLDVHIEGFALERT